MAAARKPSSTAMSLPVIRAERRRTPDIGAIGRDISTRA
jgi:hypothetical protein